MHERTNCVAQGPAGCERTERGADPSCQAYLDIVGVEFFRRYRKRLGRSGAAFEIWRDNPHLGLMDVLVRVYAARQIIARGEDYRILRVLHESTAVRGRQFEMQAVKVRRKDRLSRALVRLGGWLFSGFCVLSALSTGWPGGVLVLLLFGVAVLLSGRRRTWRHATFPSGRYSANLPDHALTGRDADQRGFPA